MNESAETKARREHAEFQRNAWRGDAQPGTAAPRADSKPESEAKREMEEYNRTRSQQAQKPATLVIDKRPDAARPGVAIEQRPPAAAPIATPKRADRVRFDGRTLREIQVAVIRADDESFTGEGKSDAYVDARFDQVVARTVLGSRFNPTRTSTPYIHAEVVRTDDKTFTGNGLSDTYLRARFHLTVDKLLGTRLSLCTESPARSASSEDSTMQARIDALLGASPSDGETSLAAPADSALREDTESCGESDSEQARKAMVELNRNSWRTGASEVIQ